MKDNGIFTGFNQISTTLYNKPGEARSLFSPQDSFLQSLEFQFTYKDHCFTWELHFPLNSNTRLLILLQMYAWMLWLWGTQLSMILGCFACPTYRSQRRRKKARKKMETRKRRTRKWIKSSWFVLLSVWDRRGQRIPPTPKVRFLFPL